MKTRRGSFVKKAQPYPWDIFHLYTTDVAPEVLRGSKKGTKAIKDAIDGGISIRGVWKIMEEYTEFGATDSVSRDAITEYWNNNRGDTIDNIADGGTDAPALTWETEDELISYLVDDIGQELESQDIQVTEDAIWDIMEQEAMFDIEKDVVGRIWGRFDGMLNPDMDILDDIAAQAIRKVRAKRPGDVPEELAAEILNDNVYKIVNKVYNALKGGR